MHFPIGHMRRPPLDDADEREDGEGAGDPDRGCASFHVFCSSHAWRNSAISCFSNFTWLRVQALPAGQYPLMRASLHALGYLSNTFRKPGFPSTGVAARVGSGGGGGAGALAFGGAFGTGGADWLDLALDCAPVPEADAGPPAAGRLPLCEESLTLSSVLISST